MQPYSCVGAPNINAAKINAAKEPRGGPPETDCVGAGHGCTPTVLTSSRLLCADLSQSGRSVDPPQCASDAICDVGNVYEMGPKAGEPAPARLRRAVALCDVTAADVHAAGANRFSPEF
jgi:hypothetical protein